jgi:uncharacterized protein (AIM24 family)
VTLHGVGVMFVHTDENFIEFTLGAGEGLKANKRFIVAFSEGIKINVATMATGEEVAQFDGPGNLLLSSSPYG